MEGSQHQYNALIVDDEEQICDLVSIFLLQTGHFKSTVTAPSATQAIQKMQNQNFDILIVDYALPNKSGLEFIHNIKQIYRYQHIKTLMVSGCLKKSDVQMAINTGIRDILVKPFTRDQLLMKVKELLNIEGSMIPQKK